MATQKEVKRLKSVMKEAEDAYHRAIFSKKIEESRKEIGKYFAYAYKHTTRIVKVVDVASDGDLVVMFAWTSKDMGLIEFGKDTYQNFDTAYWRPISQEEFTRIWNELLGSSILKVP